MTEKIQFLPEVRQDITEAFLWYEERSTGLGYEFIRCLEICFLTISKQPLIYRKVYQDYRRALVRRFPYSIFFECEEDQIIVFGVFHCAQDPKKWRKRLPQ